MDQSGHPDMSCTAGHHLSFLAEGEGDAQRNPTEQTGEARAETAKQES